ncbi:MAG: STAS domain-containing protein [Verrucomicrobiota bacterium]
MKIQHEAKTLTLNQITELNAVNCGAFRDEARAALKEGITLLDIDLSQTRQVDSSGLGALIALHKTMLARGGAVRILYPNPMVQQIMELTRLHRVFEIVKAN